MIMRRRCGAAARAARRIQGLQGHPSSGSRVYRAVPPVDPGSTGLSLQWILGTVVLSLQWTQGRPGRPSTTRRNAHRAPSLRSCYLSRGNSLQRIQGPRDCGSSLQWIQGVRGCSSSDSRGSVPPPLNESEPSKSEVQNILLSARLTLQSRAGSLRCLSSFSACSLSLSALSMKEKAAKQFSSWFPPPRHLHLLARSGLGCPSSCSDPGSAEETVVSGCCGHDDCLLRWNTSTVTLCCVCNAGNRNACVRRCWSHDEDSETRGSRRGGGKSLAKRTQSVFLPCFILALWRSRS